MGNQACVPSDQRWKDEPRVLVLNSGCVHKLSWITPGSQSFQQRQNVELARGESTLELQKQQDDFFHASNNDTESPNSDHSMDAHDEWGWYDESSASMNDIEAFHRAHLEGSDSNVVVSMRTVPPPDYILAESLSTQALWHATAARRPQQPEHERKEMERKWEENFRRSEAVTPEDEHEAIHACCVPSATPLKRVLHRGESRYASPVTKTFQCPSCHEMSMIMVHIPRFQVVQVGFEQYAEFLVVIGLGHTSFGVWRRFRDFKKLQESLKKSDPQQYRNTQLSWTLLTRHKQVFRCLDTEYLSLKCFLLQRFLHDLVFESSTPNTIREFVQVW